MSIVVKLMKKDRGSQSGTALMACIKPRSYSTHGFARKMHVALMKKGENNSPAIFTTLSRYTADARTTSASFDILKDSSNCGAMPGTLIFVISSVKYVFKKESLSSAIHAMGGFAIFVDWPVASLMEKKLVAIKLEPLPDGKTGSFSFNASTMGFEGPGESSLRVAGVEDVAELALEVTALVAPCAAALNTRQSYEE